MLAQLLDESTYVPVLIGVPLSADPNPNDNIVELAAYRKFHAGIEEIKAAYETGFKNYFGYAYSLTFSKESASDIVQNVFARIIAKINRDGFIEVENVEAYIIRSIRNEHIDRRAKEIKRPSFISMVREDSPSAEITHLSSEKNAPLKHAVENLPTAQRTCLVMYYYNELKIDEIAKELGISVSAVKTHLQRAKTALGKAELRNSKTDDEE